MYTLTGIVKKGKQRGKQLGFPTANISLPKRIPSGIYISYTMIGEKKYPSLTFIGEAQTFDETDYQAETWILDFDTEIYNQKISLQLLKKIRENQKFDSAEALIKQMKKDELHARLYFKS